MKRFNIKALAMMAVFAFWPQSMVYPEFFKKPEFIFKEPAVKVEVSISPFKIEVKGEGRLEKIDDNRVRLSCPSGQLAIGMTGDEAIYGLTRRIVKDRGPSESHVQAVGGLDRRGEIVSMWVYPSEAGYAPFYLSSRGYGMYVEGTNPGIYDIGKTDKDLLHVKWDMGSPNDKFSCVFINGPKLLDIMDRYTEMTGRPILPPRWTYLPWKWRDEHRAGKFDTLDGIEMNADLVEDINMYEKLGFPIGVYMIDRPWAAGEYGFGNFNWDANRFPNALEMLNDLKKRGWRIMLWVGPWALGHLENEFGYEAKEKGLIIGDRNFDYTNPAAVAWQTEKLTNFLRQYPIDGWKLDRGDEYNPSQRKDIYFDGRTGIQVHNDYPRMYVKTLYDATRAVRGDDFLLKARPSYTGTTQWSITYSGDVPGAVNYGGVFVSTDKGLRSVLIMVQREAMMGYPTWGSDTGGYEHFRDRRVFARWLEVSCFCPLMEIGGVHEHEPWAMPTKPGYDEEMIKIYKRYTWIHARLADYSYELAKRGHETGSPIVHPLVFDWQDDPKVKNMWDEWMYGPSLLVAPIWEKDSVEREVYLPKGEWLDLWDQNKKFTGPTTIKVSVPLDKIAVFIKADKIELLPKGLVEGL